MRRLFEIEKLAMVEIIHQSQAFASGKFDILNISVSKENNSLVRTISSRYLIYNYPYNYQVTKNDEKVMQKEVELRETKEKLIEHEQVVQNLDKQYQQAMEEKNILAEQLQAETELCAEAEEMRARY